MSVNLQARIGAVLFALWGVIHILGGGSILFALAQSPEAGYAIYQNADGSFPALAGAVLRYLAYYFTVVGLATFGVAVTLNWRNSQSGLALNTALAGLTDLGLVIFLAVPGYVTWPEAAIGIVLFLAAAIVGGMACNRATPAHT